MNKPRQDTTTQKANGSHKDTTKGTYRVRNWAAYNASLVKRGAVTLWISDEVIADWRPAVDGPRQRGGQVQYSDRAIECLLMLRAVFNLT